MIRRMRESNDNVFYCAECTYDKSNGTMFLYTTDITEVRGSVKPKDSMKLDGGFLVRRKYFRSEYEAQEYIDSLPNAMPMSRNESFDPTPLKTAKVYHPDYDSFDLFSCDESTKNQFLGRFVADCRYFLGNGNGYEGHLWAGSVEEQIDLMRKLYDDIRPDWLSERQIDDFEDAMLAVKYSKNESRRRSKRSGLREGDASLKNNYAVAVRDMHTAHIHLLTGTKSECEALIGSLETADDYMNDDYMDEYEKDEYIQTLYDEVLSQYNWINDINYREIDNRNNYYDYDSGKYYHILNKNWFDLYI